VDGDVRVLLEGIGLVEAHERPLDDPHPRRGRAGQRHLREEERDPGGVSRRLGMLERGLRVPMLQIPICGPAVQARDHARLGCVELTSKKLT
jgi:hypothetical protein